MPRSILLRATIVGCVALVVVILGLQWWFRSHAFVFDLPTSFAIPRNAITEQLDAVEYFSSEGHVDFPRGSVTIRLPNDQLITVEFSGPTTVAHKVDFELVNEAPEVDAAEDGRFLVELNVKAFDFTFSKPVRVKYRDLPIADFKRLVPRDHNEDATNEVTLAVTAEPLLAQCLVMLMFGSHLESTSAGFDQSPKRFQSDLTKFPHVVIDRLEARFKENASLTYNNSDLKVIGDSSITIRDFTWSAKKRLNGTLDLIINLGDKSKIAPGQQLTISEVDQGVLQFHAEVRLDNGEMFVKATPDEPSRLAIENCDVRFNEKHTTADLSLASLDVNLNNLNLKCLTKEKTPKIETTGDIIFSGQIDGGEIRSPHVIIKNVSCQVSNLRGRVVTADDGAMDFVMSSDSPVPVAIESVELTKGGTVLELSKTASQIPLGTFSGPSDIQIDLKDFFASVERLSCKLGDTGRIVAKELKISGYADGNVYLARDNFPFNGTGRMDGVIGNFAYYQDGLQVFSASDFSTNLEIEDVDGELVAKGAIVPGEIKLLAINSKAKDIRVALSGVEIDRDTRRVAFADLRVEIAKTFLNRLIQSELKKINKSTRDEKKPNRTTLTVYGVSGQIVAISDNKLELAAGAKARVRHELYVPQMHMKTSERVLGIKWGYPVIVKGWSDLPSLSGKATCTCIVTLQFDKGTTLDDLSMSAKLDFDDLQLDLKNVPPVIDGMITLCANVVVNLMNVSIPPHSLFASMSKHDRKLLQRIRVDTIALESNDKYLVLKIAGDFAEEPTK